MTRIDRYITVLFLRTVLICFLSLAGIFIVFHAFTSMDDLVRRGQQEGGLVRVMARYYGPYLLLLFDWTGAIIALMALLFTVGWLRRTGELTSTLAAGVSHGRLFRPMIYASAALVIVQMANREFVLPKFRDELSMKSNRISGEKEQPVLAKYDKVNRVLVDGRAMFASRGEVLQPNFRLDGDYAGFGNLLLGESAVWSPATSKHPAGYLIRGVKRPEDIGDLPSTVIEGHPILLTRSTFKWLGPNQCFFATHIHPDLLQTSQSSTRLASIAELVRQVRNPSVHSAKSDRVLLHERIIRLPLDFGLILLGLPLVINARGRNLFTMVGVAMLTVMMFFILKTVAGAMGGGGYLVSPALAAWLPLLVVGPLAYGRYRDAQLV